MKALRVRSIFTEPFLGIDVNRSKSDGYDEKETKGRRRRRVPLLERAANIALKLAVGRSSDDFLFRSTDGAELSGSNFVRDTRWHDIAGEHRIHDLRHTAATSWLRDGIDIKTISVWLGHATTQQTVNRYTHWMPAESDLAAIAKVQAARSAM